jgi:hypothetical protein
MSLRQLGLADYLGSLGQNGDSMVAHINPQEAALLKALGGSGTINPRTGLRQFDGPGDGPGDDGDGPPGGDPSDGDTGTDPDANDDSGQGTADGVGSDGSSVGMDNPPGFANDFGLPPDERSSMDPESVTPGTDPSGDDAGFFSSMLNDFLSHPIRSIATGLMNTTPIGLVANLASIALTEDHKGLPAVVSESVFGNVDKGSPTTDAIGSAISDVAASLGISAPSIDTSTASIGTNAPSIGNNSTPSISQSAPSLGPGFGGGGDQGDYVQTAGGGGIGSIAPAPVQTGGVSSAPVAFNPVATGYAYQPSGDPRQYGRTSSPLNQLGHRFFV